jgi:hypothetical protein
MGKGLTGVAVLFFCLVTAGPDEDLPSTTREFIAALGGWKISERFQLRLIKRSNSG